MRAALAAALHHSCEVGPGTNDAPRGQTTARETEEPELFTLFEEEQESIPRVPLVFCGTFHDGS